MSNIYTALKSLQENRNTKLQPSQRSFIDSLIVGNQSHLGLKPLALFGTEAEFKAVYDRVLNELKRTSIWHVSYRATLNEVSLAFKGILERLTKFKSLEYQARRQAAEAFYQKTREDFNAVVILPFQQRFDFRLGPSKGECVGFVLEWMLGMISDENPYGVDLTRLGYPKLFTQQLLPSKNDVTSNFYAKLTANISYLQKNSIRKGKGFEAFISASS